MVWSLGLLCIGNYLTHQPSLLYFEKDFTFFYFANARENFEYRSSTKPAFPFLHTKIYLSMLLNYQPDVFVRGRSHVLSIHSQDLFAELRPNMSRYTSIEEVNAALLELEEHEHSILTDKTSGEKHSDNEKALNRSSGKPILANGQSVVNGNEENGGAQDDLRDSDSDSGSGTLDPEGQDEEELDEQNHDEEHDSDEDDDDDGGGPASDEDDEVHVRQKVTEVNPQEEANFDQELRAVLQVRFSLVLSITRICLKAIEIFSVSNSKLRYERFGNEASFWSLNHENLLVMIDSVRFCL